MSGVRPTAGDQLMHIDEVLNGTVFEANAALKRLGMGDIVVTGIRPLDLDHAYDGTWLYTRGNKCSMRSRPEESAPVDPSDCFPTASRTSPSA